MIITMVMLLLVSVASVSAIRGSESSEAVTNNSRTQQLAMQAAEAALLFCERQTRTYLEALVATTLFSTATTPTVPFDIQDAPTPSSTLNYVYQWSNLSTVWDSTSSTVVTVVPLTVINTSTTNIFSAYQRAPECVVQMYEPGANNRAVITARGFGPEVVSGRGRPNGSEVWLQSVIQVSVTP
ncbi:MAG: hypothetical protein HC765_00015 [Brachymonas sp.]|nr:hypothetical protein [Brachymonas sp.]